MENLTEDTQKRKRRKNLNRGCKMVVNVILGFVEISIEELERLQMDPELIKQLDKLIARIR